MDEYKNKKVLVTGHTGFKGSWLTQVLLYFGAEVIGIALPPEKISLFNTLKLKDEIQNYYCDIRDFERISEIIKKEQPEIIFHLAAQALVRESYDQPKYTFETNIFGTVNIIEATSDCESVKSIVIITTDKVYENKEDGRLHNEDDKLGGHDPYSASKACAEFVSRSYAKSFSKKIATARSGNVIGGGDWAKERLFPDLIRNIYENKKLIIRDPEAIRPWQHVLEPTYGYLLLGLHLLENNDCAWNFGPDSFHTVEEVVNKTGQLLNEKPNFLIKQDHEKKESKILKLDNRKALILNWKPKYDFKEALKKTVDWYDKYYNKEDMKNFTLKQIKEYF